MVTLREARDLLGKLDGQVVKARKAPQILDPLPDRRGAELADGVGAETLDVERGQSSP